jgi:hypothetical protein
MKLKTYFDDRTFEEQTGFTHKELLAALQGKKNGENEINQQGIIKPEPAHHFFDVLKQFPKINQIHEFVRKLFRLYYLHRTLPYPPDDMGELAWGFSVELFCKHHVVEKSDFDKIVLESYNLLESEKREWQVDKYRSEILEQIELYLKTNSIPEKKRLSHSQIALLYAYRREEINLNNCNDIARKYEWTSPTSGESIRQKFCKWQVPQNRIGNPDTVTSRPLKRKINNIEAIIPLLNEAQRGRAINEVNGLKKLLLDLFDEYL